MWWVGALGWLALIGAGVQGLGLGDLDTDVTGFEPHLLIGSLGALLVVFSSGWIAVYLVLTGRLLGRSLPAIPSEDGLYRSVQGRSRLAVPVAVLAALAVLATAAMAVPAFTGRWPGAVHWVLGSAAVLLQALSLGVLWPHLGRHEELIRRADRALGAPGSPDSPA